MNRIRAALPWKKKNYYGDSDSTGYCSSSEVSKTLSDSQFILRPNTALLSSSYSNSSNYYALDYSEFSGRRSRDKGSTITSRTSTISSTTFKSHYLSTSTEEDDNEEEESNNNDDDEASTIRANSVRHVPMMPKLTSIRHFMSQEASSSEDVDEEEDGDEEGDIATLDEVTMTYDEEEDDEDDDITLDINPTTPKREVRNSSFRSFPFSSELMENEMDKLFDMLQVDEQIPSTSNTTTSISKRKRLLIKEPTTKIYYHEQSCSEAPLPPKPTLSRTESVPRSILKNSSSFAIYEEIYGDHLSPLPTDIRPKLPDRPIMAFQQFPPCTAFQPRFPQRLPSIRRRKKLPSLHHSTSFASYFRKKK